MFGTSTENTNLMYLRMQRSRVETAGGVSVLMPYSFD